MRALLFIGGNGPARDKISRLLEDGYYSIAADSGLELAKKLGVRPKKVVGDMDSLSDLRLLADYKKEEILRFRVDKDETDTELGFSLLSREGYDHVIILGGGGGRMDHFLGILALFDRSPGPKEWYTDDTYIASIEGNFTCRGYSGRQVSFFPAGSGVCTMESKGLRWPLDGLRWTRGDIGVSNEMTGNDFSVTMKTGRLIMVTEL
ncbi:MAG: thiamine diphosphokinase [Spirochaetales bacterium]|nr:MAG: thiamine diphosphokinase [Spirochaetales bacterium]